MELLKLAVLDLYDGEPNQGMRAIRKILNGFADYFSYDIFDVRGKNEVPGTGYDIYISTGGPGDPREIDGPWHSAWTGLIDKLWQYNLRTDDPQAKKYVFFICHSFQMVCEHFGIGEITKRRKKSFGTFPVHKTPAGQRDWMFRDLSRDFYIADFREYQVVQPDYEVIDTIGAKILALEKYRSHVPYEQAIMAIRFSPEFFGTQFHPEADAQGMLKHFMQTDRRRAIIEEFSQKKYLNMLKDLDDPNKIAMTYNIIIPRFLRNAIRCLIKQQAAVA